MRVNVSNIPAGLPGTLITLRVIFQSIKQGQKDPAIVEFTRQAIGRVDFKRERKMLDRIVRAWTKRVQILEDPVDADWIQDARVTLQSRRGDCDDLVVAIGASLEHVGFPVELIVGSQLPEGVNAFTHVWLRAWLPRSRQWVSVDPRAIIDKDIGFKIGQELSLQSLTAIGTYGWDDERQKLTDGVSVASTVNPRRRTFILGRLRPAAGDRTATLRPTGLGNPNAPVETFFASGTSSAEARTGTPIVTLTTGDGGPGVIQERAQVLGPVAAEKAARAENLTARFGPWIAVTGLVFALTGIFRNIRG